MNKLWKNTKYNHYRIDGHELSGRILEIRESKREEIIRIEILNSTCESCNDQVEASLTIHASDLIDALTGIGIITNPHTQEHMSVDHTACIDQRLG